MTTANPVDTDIAVIAMEGRFPGAPSLAQFWDLLKEGRESIRPVSDEDYLAAGGPPSGLTDPHLVKVACTLDDIDLFDADFFNLRPAEAELLDPQHRVFIECAYHAFEQAGCVSGEYDGAIGVYAGATQSKYYLDHVHPMFAGRPVTIDAFVGAVANAGSALVSRVSYLLNLTGPSVALQTACSTSLVAIHLACQDLLEFRCDMALAGGASINPNAGQGYRHVPGGPFSPDGHCRPYSADAAGMSPGDGVGVVLLKRLSDALADGDHIRAVVKGSAVNNDGSRKVGFAAPSVKGQRDVIVAAHALAGVSADHISYVEGHGTATPVGDPIEVSALVKAFAPGTSRKGFCALGSVKSNLGHLDAAAGIAGFIKTVLALENEAIPPTLHFSAPNELIDFADSPFVVADTLRPWPRSEVAPRIAGVSSFGVGGTNAHIVVGEAPETAPVQSHGGPSVVVLSANTAAALTELGEELGEHLALDPRPDIADVAATLQNGRRPMRLRRAVVADSVEELGHALRVGDGFRGEAPSAPREVAFMFPGAGSQYQRMGQQLYGNYPVYRREMDRCAQIMDQALGIDLLHPLYPPGQASPRRDNVDLAACGYPAIVSTEWSLYCLLESWGVRPTALIGHSLGEYTAACVAGVMDLEEMLPLVAERERLIRQVGGMTLSVLLDEDDIVEHLGEATSLAGVNAPEMCTVSGAADAILELERRLAAGGIEHHRLRVPGAVHSAALDPVLDEFRDLVKRVTLRPPRIPLVSNVTGTWLTEDEARDPDYWVRHLRQTVRFSAGLRTLSSTPVLVEAGPSGGLTKLAEYTLGDAAVAVPALRHAYAEQTDPRVLHNAIALMWARGVQIDWSAMRDGRPVRRVPLPGYPFQRRRFWVRSNTTAPQARQLDTPYLSATAWNGSGVPDRVDAVPGSVPLDVVVVVVGRGDIAQSTPDGLQEQGTRFVRVAFGDEFSIAEPDSYVLDPAQPDQVRALSDDLAGAIGVLDISALTGVASADPLAQVTESGRFLDATIAQLVERGQPVRVLVACLGSVDLTDTVVQPQRRMTHALAGRWNKPDSQVFATVADVDSPDQPRLGNRLMRELRDAGVDPVVAYRGRHRWVRATMAVTAKGPDPGPLPDMWVVPDGLRSSALRCMAFLSAATRSSLIITRPGDEHTVPEDLAVQRTRLLEELGATVRVVSTATDDIYPELGLPPDAHPGLFIVLDEFADADPARTIQQLTNLWDERDRFGAVVLVDLIADQQTVPRAAASQFAAASAEAAASEGLDWRLLRWRRGPEWTAEQDLMDRAGTISARGRMGADALLDALCVVGRPVVTVAAGNRPAAVPVVGEDAGTLRDVVDPVSEVNSGRARPPLSTAYVKPSSDTERQVAEVWREALGVDDIGADDNFFELGGESLLLMRMVANLRDRFIVTMSIRQLYVNDRLTISGIAAVLEEKTS